MQVFGRRHDERRLALRRAASKKRQGTKSREVWLRPGGERYGDLIFAPAMMVDAKWRQATWMGVKGRPGSAMGISVVAWSVSTGDRLVDWRDCAERDRRQRAASSALERERGDAHRRSGS